MERLIPEAQGEREMEPVDRLVISGRAPGPFDGRAHPRFELSVEVTVHSHSGGLLVGRMVDISESGMAVMLTAELPLDEIVRLEFTLPRGPVEIGALARQRRAFRYGLQFVEQGPAREVIARTCRDLRLEELLNDSAT